MDWLLTRVTAYSNMIICASRYAPVIVEVSLVPVVPPYCSGPKNIAPVLRCDGSACKELCEYNIPVISAGRVFSRSQQAGIPPGNCDQLSKSTMYWIIVCMPYSNILISQSR
jgi:hypothetical protein